MNEATKVCDARIRPFSDKTKEMICERVTAMHVTHKAALRDYAYPGSETSLSWQEDDRRNYYGEYPGPCTKTASCILPDGHPRRCAL